MSTSIRFTKILTAVAMTASIAACNDLGSSGKHKPVVTTTEAPKPIEAPAPTETPPPVAPTPPTVATETAKPPVTVENDDDGPRPVDALAAAREMLDEKSYDKALKLASIAVKKMPKRWAHGTRSAACSCRWATARTRSRRSRRRSISTRRTPTRGTTSGCALIYDKRFEEAADMLEQAVELEPVEAYMWNNLGMAYEQLDRLEDAREAYGTAVEMESELARDSLARLEGVKSVIRTAKVDTENKDGTIAPTTTIR